MMIDIRETGPEGLGDSKTFLQSGFWGEFKEAHGWKPRYFVVSDGHQNRGDYGLLVLERRLGPGFHFGYVPHGPAIEMEEAGRGAYLSALSAALRPRLHPSTMFLRFDPPWYREEARVDEGVGAGEDEGHGGSVVERPQLDAPLRRSAADIQPPDTVLLDLDAEEAVLLEGMKPKWRYNIRLAEKKGVLVTEEGVGGNWRPALEVFYRLYRETSVRDRIALHPFGYYEKLFALGQSHGAATGLKPDLRIWTASHEGEALAAIITIFWAGQAVYLYGASSNHKRNLMPAYALQWAAIRAAKLSGCGEYDFYGIPPRDDPDHPMSGLYRFKTGFGGKVVHRGGSWDLPFRHPAYSLFSLAERARLWYYKDFKKRKTGGAKTQDR